MKLNLNNSICGIEHRLVLGRNAGRKTCGFSLLEVLLALALSVVVIGAIALAIQLHLVSLGKQQTKIETKQIARSVIMMIDNDLRAAIQYKPVDYSGLDNIGVSQDLIAGMMGGEDTEGGDGGGTGDPGGGDGGEQDPENAEEPAADDPEAFVASRPTLYGDATHLAIDISRFPRIDEYNPLIPADQSTIQLPSDVKSVAYFVDESGSQAGTQSDLFNNSSLGGLYRRQIDRAVASFAGEEDIIVAPDKYAKLVAPEVAQIGFRYFNGEDWQDQWDSVEEGGFPIAIEVQVIIDHARATAKRGEYSFAGFDPETMEFQRTVVFLPVSELPE